METASRLIGIDVSTVDALTPKIIKIDETVGNFLGKSSTFKNMTLLREDALKALMSALNQEDTLLWRNCTFRREFLH